jgi:hypothetical protein
MSKRILPSLLLLLPLSVVSCGSDDDAAACYSPTQGNPSPYDSHRTSLGCACEMGKDQPICVRDRGPAYGLFCFEGRWQSVIDGPCQPSGPLPDAGGSNPDAGP